MLMKRHLTLITATFLLAAAVPAVAHHSYSAEFDEKKPIKLTGVVTKVEWGNPHIWVYLDVKDADGKVTTWGFSGSPPGMLLRRGLTKNSVKVGDVLTIQGHRAKDGSNNSSGNVITFADGHDALLGQDQVFSGQVMPAANPTQK